LHPKTFKVDTGRCVYTLPPVNSRARGAYSLPSFRRTIRFKKISSLISREVYFFFHPIRNTVSHSIAMQRDILYVIYYIDMYICGWVGVFVSVCEFCSIFRLDRYARAHPCNKTNFLVQRVGKLLSKWLEVNNDFTDGRPRKNGG